MKFLNNLLNFLLPQSLYLGPLAVGGIMAGAGILGGMLGEDGSSQSSSYDQHIRTRDQDPFQRYAGQQQEAHFRSLEELLGMGPGMEDYKFGVQSQRDYARNPFASAEDTQRSNMFASQVFAPQKQALKQNFRDQMEMAGRERARLGRSSFDPVLQAQLGRGMLDQVNQLGAQQSAFSAQYADQKAGQRADLSQMLGQQAVANRQSLMQMGNSVFEQGRAWQLNTASKFGTGNQTAPGPGFLAGALQGASSGLGMASMFGGFGGSPTPVAAGGNFGGGYGGGTAPGSYGGNTNYGGGAMSQSGSRMMR